MISYISMKERIPTALSLEVSRALKPQKELRVVEIVSFWHFEVMLLWACRGSPLNLKVL